MSHPGISGTQEGSKRVIEELDSKNVNSLTLGEPFIERQFIVCDSTGKFVNRAAVLTDNNDVDTAGATANDTLTFDGANWTPANRSLGTYTIVDAAGNGDYTTLGAARAASATNIFMRAGVYNESGDITLASNCTIVGEDVDGTIIDFGGAAGRLVVIANGLAGENIVTAPIIGDDLNLTDGLPDVTVNGGQLQTEGYTAGQFILIGAQYYEIASINSETSLTLAESYRGGDFNNVPAHTVRIVTLGASRIKISNLTIQNAGSPALLLQGVRDVKLTDVKLLVNTGIRLVECDSVRMTRVDCQADCVMKGVTNGTFTDCSVTNCHAGDACVVIDTTKCTFTSCRFDNNGGSGLAFGANTVLGNAVSLAFIGCSFSHNDNFGAIYSLDPLLDGDVIRFDSCTFANNGWRGAVVYGTCDYNNCSFSGNPSNQIYAYEGTKITNCTFTGRCSVCSIEVRTASRVLISGCTFIECYQCIRIGGLSVNILTICNNTVVQSPAPSPFPTALFNLSGASSVVRLLTVTGNTILYSTDDPTASECSGIVINTNTGSTFDAVVVTNNNILLEGDALTRTPLLVAAGVTNLVNANNIELAP